MTLRLRVLNNSNGLMIADTFAKSAKVTFGLNKSVDWSAEFPVATEAVKLISTGLRVEIYYLGVLINTGVVQDFTQEYVGVEGFLKLKGRSDLDILFDTSADPLTYYEGKVAIEALYNLMSNAGWKLGDISTWDNPIKLISDDLTNTKTRAEQIKKILESADTNLFYRVGEDLFGSPTLDVGLFNSSSGKRFITPPAGEDRLDKQLPEVNRIKKLTVKTKSTDIISSVDIKGGVIKESGIEKRLSLREYVSQDYTRFQDPDYPIVEITPFLEYRMFNKSINPYPGATIRTSAPYGTTYSDQALIGDYISGASSRVTCFSFWGAGGRLKEFTTYISILGANWTEAFQELDFYVEVAEQDDPSTPEISTLAGTTLLYSSTLAAGNYLNAGKWTYTFPTNDDNLILEFGKRYTIRLGPGYTNVNGTAWNINFWGIADSLGILDQGLRWDWNHDQFTSLSVSQRYQIATEIVIDPIDAPEYGDIKLTYDQYAPESDSGNNDAAEINAAADALYNRAVAVLRDRSAVREDWSMEAIGNNLVVKPGDTVYVQGTAEKVIDNPASTGISTLRLQVAKDLRVDQVDLNYSKDTVTAKYKLLEGDGITEEEALLSVYDESKFEPKEKGIYYIGDFWREQDQYGVEYGTALLGSSPDTTMADGRLAKLVTLDYNLPAVNNLSFAELMARPLQLSQGDRLDETPVEMINSIADTVATASLVPDTFRDPRYTGASVFSLVTDGAVGTGWTDTHSPTDADPYNSIMNVIDDRFDWVLTELEQQAGNTATIRRYLPGSFKLFGSNTGAFSGEEVELFDVVDTTQASTSEVRTYTLTHDAPYKYIQQRVTFTHFTTIVGVYEMWWQGYRQVKEQTRDFDIEMVSDIDNDNGVGVIIKVAPKNDDWSVLDQGTFKAYYLWR